LASPAGAPASAKMNMKGEMDKGGERLQEKKFKILYKVNDF
jgi:hypothetical protein